MSLDDILLRRQRLLRKRMGLQASQAAMILVVGHDDMNIRLSARAAEKDGVFFEAAWSVASAVAFSSLVFRTTQNFGGCFGWGRTANINPSLGRSIRKLIGRYSHHFAVPVMPFFLFQVLHAAEIVVQMVQTCCSS